MAISLTETKLLWGRAAGMCSNPDCQQDLTVLPEDGSGITIGEVAHIIAQSPFGPRGAEKKGPDTYENLILLCPKCHRLVDKSPEGTYTEQTLHGWKEAHELRIRQVGTAEIFEEVEELKSIVSRLLMENHQLWEDLGPHSNVAHVAPNSNLASVWALRKLDRILPNNRKIINLIEQNSELLSRSDWDEFVRFKSHAEAFENHQYGRLDNYPLFPEGFAKAFEP